MARRHALIILSPSFREATTTVSSMPGEMGCDYTSAGACHSSIMRVLPRVAAPAWRPPRGRERTLSDMARIWLVLGGASGFLSVAAGAFGAHALKGRLSPENLQIFETAARYEMYHALALLVVGLLAAGEASPARTAAAWA